MSDKKEIVSASPKIRKLAREFGADIYQKEGSQREGRVSEEDVKSYIKNTISGKIDNKISIIIKNPARINILISSFIIFSCENS